MNKLFLLRIALDCLAAGLLLFDLSYWWLGNTAHEIAGTAMLLLVIVHNAFNRRWYGTLARNARGRHGLFNVSVTTALLVAMTVLLVTSVLISHALGGVMPAYSGFTVIQIHTLAAYWLLVVVAIHLGLRWPTIMSVARNLVGIKRPNAIRSGLLRLISTAIALHGVWSSFALGLGTKLAMQMTLDWWNFEESVAFFFVHCMAVTGLYISLTYYGMKLVDRRKNAV